jgi:hypothetical protein
MAGFRDTLARAQLDAMRTDYAKLVAAVDAGLDVKVTGVKEATADIDALLGKLKQAQGALGGLATGATSAGAAFSTATPADFKPSVWENHKPVPTGGGGGGSRPRQQGDRGDALRNAVADAKKAQGGGGGGAGAPKDLKYLLKSAGIGKAALGAIGTAGALELTKLALGLRGMAQLQAITARTGLQVRRLFAGVDSMPAIRAADRFFQIFDQRTVSGKAIASTLTGMFNGIFAGVEKAEPYVSAFFKGMLIGALNVQTAWFQLRLALLPVTDAIEDAVGPLASIESAADMGKVAFVGLGVAAAVAAAPIVAIGAAVMAVSKAFEQLQKLVKEIEGAGGAMGALRDIAKYNMTSGLSQGSKDKMSQDEGRRAFDEAQARFARERADKAKAAGAPAVPTGDPKAAEASGSATGQAFAQGVVKGVDTGAAAASDAGKRIATAVDQGVRAGGQIHSPSAVTRETAKNFALGAAQGIDDGAGVVQAAADRSLVPQGSGGSAGAARGGGGPTQITVTHLWPAGSLASQRSDIEAAAEAGTWKALRAAGLQLGVSVSP